MANINSNLPPAVALPFHPPTEGLHRDNLIKPTIPETELISSYAKMRDDDSHTQFSDQARSIIQNESQQSADGASQEKSSPEQKRLLFFARRKSSMGAASESGESKLVAIKDFKHVISVIQAHYFNAVSPFPEPLVHSAV